MIRAKGPEEQQSDTNDKLSDANTQLTQGIAQLESQKAVLNGQISTAEAAKAYGAHLEALRGQLESATDPAAQAALRCRSPPWKGIDRATLVSALKDSCSRSGAAAGSEDKLARPIARPPRSAFLAAGFGKRSGPDRLGKRKTSRPSGRLEDAKKQYKDARKAAIEQANIDKLVEKEHPGPVIKAQTQHARATCSLTPVPVALRNGRKIESIDELKNLLLAKIDGVGKIYLRRCRVTIIDTPALPT